MGAGGLLMVSLSSLLLPLARTFAFLLGRFVFVALASLPTTPPNLTYSLSSPRSSLQLPARSLSRHTLASPSPTQQHSAMAATVETTPAPTTAVEATPAVATSEIKGLEEVAAPAAAVKETETAPAVAKAIDEAVAAVEGEAPAAAETAPVAAEEVRPPSSFPFFLFLP